MFRAVDEGAARESGQGWRVRAVELERNLVAAVAAMLDDQHSSRR
jgi:hypothetical protein